MILAADGLYVVTDDSQQFLRWSGVGEISRLPEHAFFLVGNDALRGSYHILPCQAFGSKQAFEEFVEQARRYREGYREEADATGAPPTAGSSEALTTRPTQKGLS
jgi:hypothetical protein